MSQEHVVKSKSASTAKAKEPRVDVKTTYSSVAKKGASQKPTTSDHALSEYAPAKWNLFRLQTYIHHDGTLRTRVFDPEKNRLLSRQIDQAHMQISRGVLSRGEIPFFNSRWGKKTQITTIRLYFSPSAISTTSTTNYAAVFALQLNNFVNYSSYAGVFDEYRPLRGAFEICTTAWNFIGTGAALGINDGFGVAVIDYASATALTSLAQGVGFDAKEFITLCQIPATTKAKTAVLPVIFDNAPDQEWTSTTTTNLALAWLKFWIDGGQIGITGNFGYVVGWMDFQFRAAV